VAAREHELEPLIVEGWFVHGVFAYAWCREQAGLLREGAVPADAVDRATAAGGDQPRRGIRRRPLARPALRCGDECLLRGFLGEFEVAEEADQRSEDAAPLVAEDLLENG
jgi:hypothetical protein